jgi:GTP-binding protein EngB required for normal cell division
MTVTSRNSTTDLEGSREQAELILTSLERAAADPLLGRLAPEIAVFRQQLQAGSSLSVAVFGGFKAGKSSFLNHLARRDVLPVGAVPVTSVVTRLLYGASEQVDVTFLDKTRRAVQVADIGEYNSESGNPENAKHVAEVEIQLPSLKELSPLQFVDTPGIGSALLHNSETTLQWLPKVRAAIVAISSEAPLSEQDIALIDNLRRNTPRVVLLLTKADLLSDAQLLEVASFVRRQVSKRWKEDIPAFFYSILPTSTDFRGELERNLLSPLIRDRDDANARIIRHKLRLLANRALDLARVTLAAATKTESNREALRQRLASERRQYELLREELRLRSRAWSATFFEWALGRLKPIQQELQARLTAGLLEQFKGWRMRLPQLLDAWRAWMQIFLFRELSEVSNAEASMFQSPLRDVTLHLERTLQAFHDRLALHVQVALGITLGPCEFEIATRGPAVPPVDIAFVFGGPLGAAAVFVPLTIFRPIVERSLVRKATYELEKNISRLASNWRDRIAAEIDELIERAEQQVLDELSGFEQALDREMPNAPRLRSMIEEIEATRTTLS